MGYIFKVLFPNKKYGPWGMGRLGEKKYEVLRGKMKTKKFHFLAPKAMGSIFYGRLILRRTKIGPDSKKKVDFQKKKKQRIYCAWPNATNVHRYTGILIIYCII